MFFLQACEQNEIDTIESTLQKYALSPSSINQLLSTYDNETNSPLHIACLHGFYRLTMILLKHGANVSAINTYRCTPLHLAALNGHIPIIQKLLLHGSDPNALDSDHETPLYGAVFAKQINAAQYLLENGAQTYHIDIRHKTALDCAVEENDFNMIITLILYGAPITKAIIQNDTLYKRIRCHFLSIGAQKYAHHINHPLIQTSPLKKRKRLSTV